MRLSLILPVAAALAVTGTAFVAAPMILSAPALAEDAVVVPAPAFDPAATGKQTIVIAGGCFWGIQAVYQHTNGVEMALSGYAGGTEADAKYELVARERTDHAESVQVTYDPSIVSLGQILQIYFSVAHDPTQLNRQGPDWGKSYRSAIFYADDAQKSVAEAYIAQLDAAKVYPQPIVTTLEPLSQFYPAEDYHQDYAYLHPFQAYIAINDAPKVENLAALFPNQFRAEPVLVASAK